MNQESRRLQSLANSIIDEIPPEPAFDGHFSTQSPTTKTSVKTAAYHAPERALDLLSLDVSSAEKEVVGPGSSLRATLGSGKGKIRIESFSGDVRVKAH